MIKIFLFKCIIRIIDLQKQTIQMMRTQYANPSLHFGIQLGKPVRLPKIKKNIMLSHLQNCETKKSKEHSLSKSSQNPFNQISLFQRTTINSQNPTNLVFNSNKQQKSLERVCSDRNFNGQPRTDLVGAYRVGAIIGKGGYSIVRMAKSWKGGFYAMKSYNNIQQCDSFTRKNIQNEVEVLENIDHPNCIKFIQKISSVQSIHIVTELLDNKSLRDLTNKYEQKKVPINVLKPIIKTFLETLKYLHNKHISHRDIKLENVLLTKNGQVKLIDFGFSVKGDQLFYDFCGTPHYLSPEIISKGGFIGSKGDIWAAGVLFYRLATGIFPFKGPNNKIVYRKICRGEYNQSQIQSEGLQRVIQNMLIMDHQERRSAQQLLKDKWFLVDNSFNQY